MFSQKQITSRQPLSSLEDDSKGTADRLHPLLKRIFENRNVRTRSELDYSLKRLHPPQQLKGIDSATAILQQTLAANQKIVVIGDYDADGATGTAVAVLGLHALGATDVAYVVPNRFEYGYGLSPQIAELALKAKPALIITVDNGISSVQGIALLRAAGVSVIVTDHHLAGAELPDANAIVNPNQPHCEFPSKALSGVGVMFYLLLAFRTQLREADWFNDKRPEPNLSELLDLVALGTMADMVPLDYNNRILVARGVDRVRAGQCRPGIKALLEVANRNSQSFTESDFSFAIAPRINAAGRMKDISIGIECLLADDETESLRYARELNTINLERRDVEHTMQETAMKIVARIEKTYNKKNNKTPNQFGLCLFDPKWHQGIVGLVASRVKDKTHQPVIAFAPNSAEPESLTGSARSIPGLHIRDLLEAISSADTNLIEKFGGHAMAAGLTIRAEQLETFSQHFRERVSEHFAEQAPKNQILTDGKLTADDFTVETAEMLYAASPWGQRFPPPVFEGEFRVVSQRIVGEQHLKMMLEEVDSKQSFDAIAFRFIEPGQAAKELDIVKVAYQLQVNNFQGRHEVQLLVEYLQPLTEPQ